jgi:hypothetical protein
MTGKFFVPIATMLAGILVWVVFLLLHVVGLWRLPAWLAVTLCVAAAGLIVFSGVRCRQVDGPRVGNVVRTVLLLVFAASTWWKTGVVPGAVFAAGAVVTAALFLAGPPRTHERSGTRAAVGAGDGAPRIGT